MTSKVVIEADGGSRGNPGPAGSGALLIDAETGKVLAEAALFIGVATNNVAEYKAVLVAIELVNELAPDAEILVRMDSKLVVEQMSGRWKVKHESMSELAGKVADQIGDREVIFEWIPREQNSRADALANEAMDKEASEIRKFVGEPGTSSISVITSASKARVVDIEFNPELPSSVRAPRKITKKLTTVILVRHGRTDFTEKHLISGRGGQDPSLSEAGILDATRAAEELSRVGTSGLFASVPKPTAIVSSPLARTRETASMIAAKLSLPYEVHEDVAEISFGDWDGHTNQEVAEKWPDVYEKWRGDVLLAPPGGGESITEFDNRVQSARAELVSKFEGQTVVVVSHVMPIRGFIKNAMAADWPAYWRISLSPCSITVLRFWGEEAAEVTCVNYSGHL